MDTGLRLCAHCAHRRTPEGQTRAKGLARGSADDHDQRLAQIAAISDRIERLVSAVRFIRHDMHPADYRPTGPGRSSLDSAGRARRQAAELAQACPDFCRTDGYSGLVFDNREVACWFVERLTNAGIKPDFTFFVSEVQGKGRKRVAFETRHDGWTIPDGSNHLMFLPDGRTARVGKGLPDSPNWCQSGTPDCPPMGKNELDEIGKILRLPKVEIRRSLPA
jgi:hypothetical protein